MSRMFEIHKINTNQHSLYVESFGQTSSPACLLIPEAMKGAWGFSGRFCQKIAEGGFYVIRFDHRDIG